MSAKAIREYQGKLLLHHWLPQVSASSPVQYAPTPSRLAQFKIDTTIPNDKLPAVVADTLNTIELVHPWVKETQLVAKPDMLIKRRGKSGLLILNKDWNAIKEWITSLAGKEVQVEAVKGRLTSFVIEPFLPHPQNSEYYICIHSLRDGDELLFTHEGGIDIGDIDAKGLKLKIPTNATFPSSEVVRTQLLKHVDSEAKKAALVSFLERLYAVYLELQFTYLEINPLVVLESQTTGQLPSVFALDLAAKIDQTAEFECGQKWSVALSNAPAYRNARAEAGDIKTVADLTGPQIEFPAPFGREMTKEEAYVASLDAKTGASLKLTILNKNGRIWTMVAGGGASVVYSDAIAALGFANELANYGEYSGAPSEAQTYEYAKTILDLMTRGSPHPQGKVLIIGGGIANFTNVAATFKGIVRALKDYQQLLVNHKVRIFVRRGGPNYQEGLKLMRNLGENLGVQIQVFGPETHITSIVPLALSGKAPKWSVDNNSTSSSYDPLGINRSASTDSLNQLATNAKKAAPTAETQPKQPPIHFGSDSTSPPKHPWYSPFTNSTRSFVYGMQPRAVQGMLDFDYICRRPQPSVAAMIYPFGGAHVQKFYWGTQETLLPVYQDLKSAMEQCKDVEVVVNFASCRSVYDSTMDILKFSDRVKVISIIAEGVPELRARQLLAVAQQKGVLIIGPATVGGIKPGCFKIGNTGGMMDNIVSSKLYRPGSVAYVSKSGGMSNELNNIISRTTDGVYEGVAIGGDRYPGSTFIDHLLRFEQDPNVKILVLLGEVGGVEEYEVAKAVESGKIKKPVVAWCIGTCAKMFTTEVQFGHAGSLANSDAETADCKNKTLRAKGVIVPETFEDLPHVLSEVYQSLVSKGVIVPQSEPEVPKIPLDYAWAQELGMIRKPASFVSTICDDRGQELLYAGMRISDVFKENIGIGGVVSLLWFKRRLPDYACKFIEMVLMLTADHGPAVSGAHNAIVTARAGKDLVSSLCAGILTIGERFGGALDGAADQFSSAYDKNWTPRQFVDTMRRQNRLILGIGHKIKSRTNPDLRVQIIKEYAKKNFPQTPILDYAIAVEDITTSKKDNLILNVDGAIGVLFVDLLRYSGAFTREEADEILKIGTLNGLFVLGRSIGFIGHFLDQKRLKQGLYRHPWDDISYLVGQEESERVLTSAAKSS